jgi:hypothetical protein
MQAQPLSLSEKCKTGRNNLDSSDKHHRLHEKTSKEKSSLTRTPPESEPFKTTLARTKDERGALEQKKGKAAQRRVFNRD